MAQATQERAPRNGFKVLPLPSLSSLLPLLSTPSSLYCLFSLLPLKAPHELQVSSSPTSECTLSTRSEGLMHSNAMTIPPKYSLYYVLRPHALAALCPHTATNVSSVLRCVKASDIVLRPPTLRHSIFTSLLLHTRCILSSVLRPQTPCHITAPLLTYCRTAA
jgi:hypothetical protein